MHHQTYRQDSIKSLSSLNDLADAVDFSKQQQQISTHKHLKVVEVQNELCEQRAFAQADRPASPSAESENSQTSQSISHGSDVSCSSINSSMSMNSNESIDSDTQHKRRHSRIVHQKNENCSLTQDQRQKLQRFSANDESAAEQFSWLASSLDFRRASEGTANNFSKQQNCRKQHKHLTQQTSMSGNVMESMQDLLPMHAGVSSGSLYANYAVHAKPNKTLSIIPNARTASPEIAEYISSSPSTAFSNMHLQFPTTDLSASHHTHLSDKVFSTINIVIKILSFLKIRELLMIRSVGRSWCLWSRDWRLWQHRSLTINSTASRHWSEILSETTASSLSQLTTIQLIGDGQKVALDGLIKLSYLRSLTSLLVQCSCSVHQQACSGTSVLQHITKFQHIRHHLLYLRYTCCSKLLPVSYILQLHNLRVLEVGKVRVPKTAVNRIAAGLPKLELHQIEDAEAVPLSVEKFTFKSRENWKKSSTELSSRDINGAQNILRGAEWELSQSALGLKPLAVASATVMRNVLTNVLDLSNASNNALKH